MLKLFRTHLFVGRSAQIPLSSNFKRTSALLGLTTSPPVSSKAQAPRCSTQACAAKPQEVKLPKSSVKVFCNKCRTQLYRYKKGGKGALVKCFVERIVEDYTNGDLKCHSCGSEFARPTVIKGKPANKIIRGKVYMKK